MIPLKQPKNPFLLEDAAYFTSRRKSRILHSVLYDKRKKKVMLKQDGMCGWCERRMGTEDQIQLHHKIPFKDGGKDNLGNLMAIHSECHKQLTFKSLSAKKKGGRIGL